MNVLPANEVKKHGVIAIEKKLKYGPVHILKHNHPLFVVLTEEDYQEMLQKKRPKSSGLLSMLSKPATGRRSRAEIDQQLNQERDEWSD